MGKTLIWKKSFCTHIWMRLWSGNLERTHNNKLTPKQNDHFQKSVVEKTCFNTIAGHMTLSHSNPLNNRLGTEGKYSHVLKSQAEMRGGASRSQNKWNIPRETMDCHNWAHSEEKAVTTRAVRAAGNTSSALMWHFVKQTALTSLELWRTVLKKKKKRLKISEHSVS